MEARENFALIHAVVDGEVEAETAIKHQKAEAKKPKVFAQSETKKSWQRKWEEKTEAQEDWRREQRDITAGKK